MYSEAELNIPEHIPEETASQRAISLTSEVSPLSTAQSSLDHLPISPVNSPGHAPPDFSSQATPTPTQRDFKSQIPRRKVPGSNDASKSMADNKQATRWDDYSGEPSEDGKPAAVRPGAQPIEQQYPQLKERTRQILADLKNRSAAGRQTTNHAPAADPLDEPPYKEPWKGASGRTALVEPVKNTPVARLESLKIPERSAKRETVAMRSALIDQTYIEPEAIPLSAPVQSNVPTIRPVDSEESLKPVAPLKVVKTPQVLSLTTMDTTTELQSPFRSPLPTSQMELPKMRTPILGQDSPTLGVNDDFVQTPTQIQPVHTPQKQPTLISTYAQLPRDAKSRFSWATYTTTTANDSPRSALNVSQDDSPLYDSSPLMPRKRPIASHTSPLPVMKPYSNFDASISNASLPLRKPVASEKLRSASALSSASRTKELPQCPPEMEAADKIATLAARMDDLARRKRNLNKIIIALHDSVRRNLITYNHHKRKEMEKMITNMNLELAEVWQEEHDVGIQLHRAQKKRDREDNYEQPTGLWIKRVTS